CFSPEFINGLKFLGVSNYRLALKVGVPIMLLRNIDQANGLCNWTRLQVLRLTRTSIRAKINNGTHFGKEVIIPRLRITTSDKHLPIKIVRKQYPLSLSFAMTINKSQGQSLLKVGLYLPRPVFTHGQLYVALSRVKSKRGLEVVVCDEEDNVSNHYKCHLQRSASRKLAEKSAEKDGVNDVKKSGSDDVPFSFPNKQGLVWILEKEKIPKTSSPDKAQRQQKRKIEIVEVSPVRKHANVKDKSLIVTELDGSLTNISLKGCIVEAVSATNLPSRKWAKKYPIKVENKSSVIYHGNKFFYIYFETSSEKESWCTALRLASCDDKDKLIWFYRLRSEFHSYLASLNVEYPSFLKPSIGFNPETGDKSIKIDGSSNKVRHFLKKLAKKTSRVGRDDKRFGENSVGGGSGKPPAAQTGKKAEEIAQGSTPRLISSGNGSRSSDADINDKITTDDGTLCCSLLISRNSIQARIQRTLSTIRTPSYIGEILCTSVDPGNVPPYIHGMRVLPSDLKEVVVMEIDIEYYGGAVLDIETRLEVQELENTDSSDSTSVNEVTSDLLEGVMKLNERTNQPTEPKGDEVRKFDYLYQIYDPPLYSKENDIVYQHSSLGVFLLSDFGFRGFLELFDMRIIESNCNATVGHWRLYA
nr:testis-expressed sequence 2 protein-like [Tanacetum cinerariifolium]